MARSSSSSQPSTTSTSDADGPPSSVTTQDDQRDSVRDDKDWLLNLGLSEEVLKKSCERANRCSLPIEHDRVYLKKLKVYISENPSSTKDEFIPSFERYYKEEQEAYTETCRRWRQDDFFGVSLSLSDQAIDDWTHYHEERPINAAHRLLEEVLPHVQHHYKHNAARAHKSKPGPKNMSLLNSPKVEKKQKIQLKKEPPRRSPRNRNPKDHFKTAQTV